MVKVVIVNGVPRSGKDTFVEKCLQIEGVEGVCVSMVDFTKEIAKEIGWDGEKTLRSRKMLSNLKDLIDDWNDGSFNYIRKYVAGIIENFYRDYGNEEKESNFFIFIMAREPKDIARLKKFYNAVTVIIRNPDRELESECFALSNHADAEVFDSEYDYYVWNEGTLDDLEANARAFIEELKGEKDER